MKTPASRSAAIALLFVTLTVAMTWPQATRISTQVYDADDPLLSIWRLSWIAHILPESPADLLNGNIFYPEKRTLAYTDSTLLEGFAGAPLIWAGVSPVTTYNLLLLFSIAFSGWAMWRYASHLSGNEGAGRHTRGGAGKRDPSNHFCPPTFIRTLPCSSMYSRLFSHTNSTIL